MAPQNEQSHSDMAANPPGGARGAAADSASGDAKLRESGDVFMPRFDAAGLVTAVVTDADSGALLMVAHMNREAIEQTMASGRACFWSRSRSSLWVKGETSGNFLQVEEIRVDCDQDALWLIARPVGPVCHTGAPSCFYRKLDNGGLSLVDDSGCGA